MLKEPPSVLGTGRTERRCYRLYQSLFGPGRRMVR